MKIRHILLSLLCACSLRAYDCVPLTYKTLAELINAPISYQTWCNKLITDGKTAPTFQRSIEVWNTTLPNTPLQCIFVQGLKETVTDAPIEYGVPYLWIGLAPVNLAVKDPNAAPGESTAHAAILIIASGGEYFILHTVSLTEYYVERLAEAEFFSRTFAVFRVHSKEVIRWNPLPKPKNAPF